MWAEVITFLGGATILLAVVAWLIRSLAVHLLEKDLTTFKQNLVNESNRELETLKAKLEIESARQQIKLSTLQVRRLEFLEDLYKRLVRLSAEADSFLVEPVFGDDKELKGKADAFIDSYLAFYRFFGEHAIFVSSAIEKQIGHLHSSHFNVALSLKYGEADRYHKAVEKLVADFPQIVAEANAIRVRVAAEFRDILGVES